MAIRFKIHLHFGNDVFSEHTVSAIPFEKGIYIAYPGHFNGEFVELREPLYIGMAEDTTIADRIRDHAAKQHQRWKEEYCHANEDIFYRIAKLEDCVRDVEAALIFTHKPPCNINDKENYNGNAPCPDITTDLSLPNIDGIRVDMQNIMNKVAK